MNATEPDAFEALYRLTSERLLTYFLRRLEEPGRAADLLAETFLVAWRRVEAIPEGDEAVLWLFGVARRVLANDRRRSRSELVVADRLRAQLREQVMSDPAEVTAWRVALDAALEQLSHKAREVLLLSAFEGFTPAEIATVTGSTAGTVRVRLHRARTALAAELEPQERPTSILPSPV